MSPERWQQIEEIYHSALERAAEERAAFLDEACGGDAELRREVESLLQHGDSEEALVDRPAWEAAGDLLDTHTMDQAGELVGHRISHYEILQKLGEGGMGRVYRAVDARLGRSVAIKVVNAEFTQRFEREARAISALNHPHICTLHDVGEHEGAPYLVMEYVEGKPLKGPLPVSEALRYAIQTAQALAAAHKAGIVHRDLKPDNILLTAEGSVKVLDFGLAKLRPTVKTDAPTLTTMTEQGAIAGTGPYMSPEQVQGEPVDARSDIFSFGAVLYELLSGRRAFRRETTGATLAAVIAQEPPPLKEAPSEVARIVGKMLAKKRESRYQSAEAILVDLEAAAAGAGLASRRRWLALAAALVTVVGVAGGLDVRGLRTRLITGLRAPPPSVRLAVLPFENLTGDPEQEYLSDGLTQEIIAQLGSLHPASLSVIARTSVMHYKKSDKSIDQIGRELGVAYILEGSARREGGRVRITAELIQVRGQTQLWAESFERELASILALQSEVAKKVAGSLALRLLPAEQARLANVRQVNPEAYEAYLKGQFHWHRLSPQDLDAALQYFELALEKDPNYALGYAGIAEVWAGRQQMGVASPDEATPKATAAAEKALELDNTSAEVHYASAIVKAWSEWDWEGAETAFRRAIALNPSYPDAHAYYSHLLYIMRRPKEALEHMEQALAVDPFNHLFQSLHGCGLVLVGRYDDAIVQLRSALRTAPGSSIAPAGLWYAFHEKGMYGEALASAITLYAGIGYGEAAEALRRGEAKANYREAMRDAGEAKANYREAMRDAGEALAARSSTAYVSANEIATLFACAGMNDQALDWLEKGVEVHEPNMPYIGLMPYFQGLHDAPRFQELVRRMKLRL